MPSWLRVALAATLLVAMRRARATSVPGGMLRAIRNVSTSAYALTALLDLAEHFRLEKHVTGRYLRWVVIPPSESLVHAGIVATNFSMLLLARRGSRHTRVRDLWLAVAPGLFLALGWLDELAFHRRRTQHREDIIHTTQHLAEGIMWTAVYRR